MKKGGCIFVVLALVVIYLLVFGKTAFVSGFIYSLSNHLIAWIVGIATSVSVIISFVKLVNGDDGTGKSWLITLGLTFVFVSVLIIQNAVTSYALYRHTTYKPTSTLVPQTEIRDVPYTVAATNFAAKNPDSMTTRGDLDYVNGQWIASINPTTWNKFGNHTEGYFFYDPSRAEPVGRELQSMPFAENGLLFNSDTYFVRSNKYFVEFHEILYTRDPETNEVLGVISLIKRAGFARYPYVSDVMVVHSSGERAEMLTVDEAEADPRLANLALKPEWLAAQEVEAYGFKEGALRALFTRDGRIQIQQSTVNSENSAPFHLKTVNGNMWVTPYSPLKGTSIIGVAYSSSHDINGIVNIWKAGTDTYVGADYAVSSIEGNEVLSKIYTWYRESGESKCGNTTILELIPLVRNENGVNKLYSLGYVSTAPNSVKVMFYAIIDPKTEMVYETLKTPEEVNAWLRGETELKPLTDSVATKPEVVAETAAPVPCTVGNYETLTLQQLFENVKGTLAEIESRTK